MKVHRSTKMSLRFATASKLEAIQAIRTEYSRLVNAFIDKFWPWTRVPENNDLTAYHLHAVHTDASFSIAQDAAREARSMVATAKHQPLEEGDDSIVRAFDKPHHYGNRMILSHHVARIETSESATGFDAWLVLTTVQSLCGMKKLRIPIKLHRHYHKLAKLGKQATTVTITPTYVQVSFEIETGEKLNFKTAVGVDTGIKTLGEVFECLKCSFKAHADLVGAQNIVARFLTGPYGAGFKAAQLGN